jgi:hypothetical protein
MQFIVVEINSINPKEIIMREDIDNTFYLKNHVLSLRKKMSIQCNMKTEQNLHSEGTACTDVKCFQLKIFSWKIY